MGGKSRKTGHISKALIDKLKKQKEQKLKKEKPASGTNTGNSKLF